MTSLKALYKNNKARRRVIIAKDVIKQLKTEKLKPSNLPFSYLRIDAIEAGEFDKNFQSILKNKDTVCKVCAIGGLFVATVSKFDKYSLSYCDSTDDIIQRKYLSKFFSKSQLKLIEHTYEGWDDNKTYIFNYPEKKDRLIAICENIIKNKGTFIL